MGITLLSAQLKESCRLKPGKNRRDYNICAICFPKTSCNKTRITHYAILSINLKNKRDHLF